MKNSDQPIVPALMQRVGSKAFRLNKEGDPPQFNYPCTGLTKREYFAALAMQGILTSMDGTVELHDSEIKTISIESVQCADALLEALNNH